MLESNRSVVAGEHEREAELLRNHMHDLEQLTKLKADNDALHKAQEHLRYLTGRFHFCMSIRAVSCVKVVDDN